MEPWYKVVQPRPEVSAGRSFNPDEFAIALEQVVSGKAPEDYTNPINFFARTCFTRALREHIGMVLRHLNGETANAAPVLTLITQFGGGKTHTLAALYHLVNNAGRLLTHETLLSKVWGREYVEEVADRLGAGKMMINLGGLDFLLPDEFAEFANDLVTGVEHHRISDRGGRR